jgi:hypothetical protein
VGRQFLPLGISLFVFSCVPKSVILDHPKLVSIYFEKKIDSLEKKDSLSLAEKRKIVKTKVEYAFGVIMEKSDRLIDEDYSLGLAGYKNANFIFKEAKTLSLSILKGSHPEFDSWLKGKADISFSNDDIFDLYWLAASYGGAIKSSRGNPFELVNLPTVGKLLRTALALDPEWGQGALYSAMMSYTSSRPDLSGETLKDSISYYFEKAVLASDSLDAGPFMTYAESIHKASQDRDAFENNLNFVLNMDVKKSQEFELSNIIAQKRAKWLLSKANEFFLE